MLRFLRKARQSLIDEKKVSSYILYALGEIFLVVIGILIALEINNWNEERQRRQKELTSYENIKEQISSDGEQLLREIDFNTGYFTQFQFGLDIIERQDRSSIDTLGWIAHNLLNYSDFDKQGNIYETIVNSGQLELLHNHDIINGLRSLEDQYLYINRMENIHYDAIMKYVIPAISRAVIISDGQVERPDILYSFEFKNMILALLRIMQEKNDVYQRAVDQINSLIALITEETAADGQ